jgi:glutamate-1-semialdehyde aminotransferase
MKVSPVDRPYSEEDWVMPKNEVEDEFGCPADSVQVFQDELLARGVRIALGGRWFVGLAHGEQEVEAAVSAAEAAFGALKNREHILQIAQQ